MSELVNREAEWSVVASIIANPDVVAELAGSQLEADDFVGVDTRTLYAKAVEHYYADKSVETLIIAEAVKNELARAWEVQPEDVASGVLEHIKHRDHGLDARNHAKIVKRLATSRRLLEVVNQAATSIMEGKKLPEEVASIMGADALAVTGGLSLRSEIRDWMSTGRDYAKYLQVIKTAHEEGHEQAVFCGQPCVDDYTRGILPGEMWVLGGMPGVGKALALDTPIPTPGGWTTMGELEPGWFVLGPDGRPTVVKGVTGVMHQRTCYRIVLSDGESIVADAEHQWLTTTKADRQSKRVPTLRTTEEIRDSLLRRDAGLNHRIINCAPLCGNEVDPLVDPWTLGFWLGDGNTSDGAITVGDEDRLEVRQTLEAVGWEVSERGDGRILHPIGLGFKLRELGVLGEKHIPAEDPRATESVRRSLLAGIIDSDGHVNEAGHVEVSTMSNRLADNIAELVVSLGMVQRTSRTRAVFDGRFAGWRYRIHFHPLDPIARLLRKRRGKPIRNLSTVRFIRQVIEVPSVPVKCIEVEGGIYLAGRGMVPTHNSGVAWCVATGFAEKQMRKQPHLPKLGTLIVSMEMGLVSSATRLAQSITNLDGMKLRAGEITDPEYKHILREWLARDGLPIYFNYASNFRLSQLRALITEAVRRHNVGLVVIDHFRQLDTDRYVQDPLQADEIKARFLKESIAKDLNVSVICLAHTVKLGGRDGNPRPTQADLRGSGQIAAATDFLSFLHKPGKNLDYAQKAELGIRDTDMEMLWEKARHTQEGHAQFTFDPSKMTMSQRT